MCALTYNHKPHGDIRNIRVPLSVLSHSASALSSMSPKMNWIFSLARSSLEVPWSELWRMSEAKRALMELGHVTLACSGSEGPIIALHSSTAFSLSRTSIRQGPLVENKTDSTVHTPRNRTSCQSFLISDVGVCTAPVHNLGPNGRFIKKTEFNFTVPVVCVLASLRLKLLKC